MKLKGLNGPNPVNFMDRTVHVKKYFMIGRQTCAEKTASHYKVAHILVGLLVIAIWNISILQYRYSITTVQFADGSTTVNPYLTMVNNRTLQE